MSFLLPFAAGAADPEGDVGAACQSRSNNPPPPLLLVFAAGLAAAGALATGGEVVEVLGPLGAAGASSSSDERGPETLVVAGPGPTSPPSRSIALGAGAFVFRVLAEEDDAVGFAGGTLAVGEAPPTCSSVAGSDGGGPSFAHLCVSYLLRIKLSTLCSGGIWPAFK
jgi:hypothetical protein